MKKAYLLFALSALAVVMAGCTKPTTPVEIFYGASYELAKQSQFADPDAGKKPVPVEGLEGTVGKKIIDRYETGFDKPAPKTESYSITVGGMTTKK